MKRLLAVIVPGALLLCSVLLTSGCESKLVTPGSGEIILPSPSALESVVAEPGQPSAEVSKDPAGNVHSDFKSTGKFLLNKLEQKSSRGGREIKYVVQVEDSLGLDPDTVAEKVHTTLDDDRGWAPIENVSFKLIVDQNDADLVVTLATGGTVNKLCQPLDTENTWGCRSSNTVNLNADRWLYATQSYEGVDLEIYRTYLINHEIGHFLGHGHLNCPAQDGLAPVMQQQSMSLQGCLPNGWPANDPGR